jgi:hypothetical protein
VRLLPAVVLLALACGGEETETGADEGAADSVPDTVTMVAFEAAGVPDYTPMRERGIGVVHFDPGPRLASRAADTIRVMEAFPPNAVIARLIADSLGVYRFEAAADLLDAPGALEFGYEEIGLPALESAGIERWLVHLGTRAAEPVTGWVAIRPGLARTLWEDLLPTLPLFFVVPSDSIAFHASREGPVVPFPIPPPSSGDPGDPGDYILWPLERSGDWMRVRAVTPSDYCAEPPSPREDTLWIRWAAPASYPSTGGWRPRVWYFTRGC